MNKTIHHYSTVRGVESKRRDAIYRGFTYRIPERDFPKKVEEYLAQDMTKIESLIAGLPEDEKAGEVLERYECFDVDTSDVLVMWRIPTYEKKKGSRPIIGPAKNIIH